MVDTRTLGSWLRLTTALSACALGCEAQASEGYFGEPLLELHGNAIITTDTGGEAVSPALCFQRGAPMRLPESVYELPPEIHAPIEPSIEAFEAISALADEVAIWVPNQLTEIVDVESLGRFPAEFNIMAYVPPGPEFIQPLFDGEPPIATGFLCAVRDGHPDVVNRPVTLQQTECEGEASPCVMNFVHLSHDTDAYFAETFHCPTPDSPGSECERTTQGDSAVARNVLGLYIEGTAAPLVIYLAEPAKAGSYTAWRYGAPDGIAAGFHLVQAPPFEETLEANRQRSERCRSAYADARLYVNKEHADRVHTRLVESAGLQIDNIDSDPFLQEAFQRRYAELSMEHCAMPKTELLSHTEPLQVRFLNEVPKKLPGDFPNLP